MAPLKNDGLKIWEETGTGRWTKLTLREVLKDYVPVDIEDFDISKLENDTWVEQMEKIIAGKKSKKIGPGKVELVFTDNRQDVWQGQKAVNINGEEKENDYSFVKMIKNKVRVLTPEQWIILASQKYKENNTYLSRNTWDWMMAVLKNKDGIDPPVSAAFAGSGDDEVDLRSDEASYEDGRRRWRVAL